mgnify:FL=1
MAMLTDPGMVPPLWGFYMGDSEQKRRRYCLMCHVFKPERCHHCSACNRCVLNMDHHCPWINNCVGFYNRKFFLLLLVYVLLSAYTVAVSMAKPTYDKIFYFIQSRDLFAYKQIISIGGYGLDLMLSVVLSLFFKFHLKLLFRNSTTIENMDKKTQQRQNTYDKGPKSNWEQVFGRNPWLWFLPMHGASGKPIGDGVIWNQEQVYNYEEEVPANEGESRRTSRVTGSGIVGSREIKSSRDLFAVSPRSTNQVDSTRSSAPRSHAPNSERPAQDNV